MPDDQNPDLLPEAMAELAETVSQFDRIRAERDEVYKEVIRENAWKRVELSLDQVESRVDRLTDQIEKMRRNLVDLSSACRQVRKDVETARSDEKLGLS
jgi:uncharacterized coiled-coil DUF342 family protein